MDPPCSARPKVVRDDRVVSSNPITPLVCAIAQWCSKSTQQCNQRAAGHSVVWQTVFCLRCVSHCLKWVCTGQLASAREQTQIMHRRCSQLGDVCEFMCVDRETSLCTWALLLHLQTPLDGFARRESVHWTARRPFTYTHRDETRRKKWLVKVELILHEGHFAALAADAMKYAWNN